MKSVTKRLRSLRAERDITQRDLAIKTKMPVLRYWEIENGYRDADDREQRRIAKALRVTVADVFVEAAV